MNTFQDELNSVLADVVIAKNLLHSAALNLDEAARKLKYINTGMSNHSLICSFSSLDFGDLYRSVLFLRLHTNQLIGSTKAGDLLEIDRITTLLGIEK